MMAFVFEAVFLLLFAFSVHSALEYWKLAWNKYDLIEGTTTFSKECSVQRLEELSLYYVPPWGSKIG